MKLHYIITCRRCQFKLPAQTDQPPKHSAIEVQSDGEAVAAGWQRRLVGGYIYGRRDYEYSDKMIGWVCPKCVAELDSQVEA